jgi:aspartate/methionine/tyrosine aminotransferase
MTRKTDIVTDRRVNGVKPFLAMGVLARARALEAQGRSILHLELGEPSAPPPPGVARRVAGALAGEPLGYTQALGRPSLRAGIAGLHARRHGLAVDPARVAVTTGSSAGFVLAFLAAFEAGAEIAAADPGYPAYANILASLGMALRPIPTGPGSGHALDVAGLDAAYAERPFAGVLAMSPANPTGVTMPPGRIGEIARWCAARGVRLISDEIYHGLTYAAAAETALAASEGAIVVNSFSKYFALTGWRVGWLVLPHDLVDPVERLAMNLYLSAPTISQIAAEAALEEADAYEALREGYDANRRLLLAALPALGLRPWPADGAFYCYCDVSEHANDSIAFAARALDEIGVAMTPGVDFSPVNGHRFVRLSYAGSRATVEEALERLRGWLR